MLIFIIALVNVRLLAWLVLLFTGKDGHDNDSSSINNNTAYDGSDKMMVLVKIENGNYYDNAVMRISVNNLQQWW